MRRGLALPGGGKGETDNGAHSFTCYVLHGATGPASMPLLCFAFLVCAPRANEARGGGWRGNSRRLVSLGGNVGEP